MRLKARVKKKKIREHINKNAEEKKSHIDIPGPEYTNKLKKKKFKTRQNVPADKTKMHSEI